ncbi:site-specific integrase [Bacillus sp. OAE603]|uniref:tyrosine-type recombinase/integrase n=1 Tax=Gottfriedia sp. OAE603 TaxID=2663872 RepID=UPI0017897B18
MFTFQLPSIIFKEGFKYTGFDILYLNVRNGIFTPHFLRHFYAIYSAEQGVDLFRIQQSLGHESIKTTMLYLDKQTKCKHYDLSGKTKNHFKRENSNDIEK